MDFPYEQVAAFHAVAKYGSFSKAGIALLRSQSAVSVQVAKLEATLGKRLFDRTTKHVVLTEATADLATFYGRGYRSKV